MPSFQSEALSLDDVDRELAMRQAEREALACRAAGLEAEVLRFRDAIRDAENAAREFEDSLRERQGQLQVEQRINAGAGQRAALKEQCRAEANSVRQEAC